MTLIRVIVTVLLLGQLDAVRHASVQFEIKKHAIHNAFRKRRWVAEKFLSGGNADGMTYLQYMFDEFKSTGDDFRRAFRVTRQVFSHLETRLGVKLSPSHYSIRRDTISTREKIAIALHYMGHKGTVHRQLCEFSTPVCHCCRISISVVFTLNYAQAKCVIPRHSFAAARVLVAQ